jgi:hypothetical protein
MWSRSPTSIPLTTLAYVLGVTVDSLEPRQRDGWRRFAITSTSNPIVEHATLLSFLTTDLRWSFERQRRSVLLQSHHTCRMGRGGDDRGSRSPGRPP